MDENNEGLTPSKHPSPPWGWVLAGVVVGVLLARLANPTPRFPSFWR